MLDEKLRQRLLAIPHSAIISPTGIRTLSLFKDSPAGINIGDTAVYYLDKVESDESCISLKQVYMQIGDPSEYEFAMLCFKELKNFRKIEKVSWFLERLNNWREELQCRLQSEAIKGVEHLLYYGDDVKDSTKLSAFKWLHEKGYNILQDNKKSVGRPKKVKQDQDDGNVISDDIARLGLIRSVSNG